MKKITEEQCLDLLKEKFPKFIPYRDAYVTCWETTHGVLALMGPFSEYAIGVIKANNTAEIENILDCAEFLLCNGDQLVQNAVATVFLEDLMNKDPDEIKFGSICKYLGKNSIDYCRAWDEFCGMRTEGLWDDEKK